VSAPASKCNESRNTAIQVCKYKYVINQVEIYRYADSWQYKWWIDLLTDICSQIDNQLVHLDDDETFA
jgi:hypothetical protein